MKKNNTILGNNIRSNSFQVRPIFINVPSNIFLSMKFAKNVLSPLLVKKVTILSYISLKKLKTKFIKLYIMIPLIKYTYNKNSNKYSNA